MKTRATAEMHPIKFLISFFDRWRGTLCKEQTLRLFEGPTKGKTLLILITLHDVKTGLVKMFGMDAGLRKDYDMGPAIGE